MLDADIGKPTGPDPGEGQEGFFLTCHPLLQTLLLDTRSALGLRLWLFATACHGLPLYAPHPCHCTTTGRLLVN